MSVNFKKSGFAIAPISLATCFRSASLSSSDGSKPFASVQNAAIQVPLISWGTPTTAASTTDS